jgi:hypothetical protein
VPNLLVDHTGQDVEMADFSEHDLIMIQRWQQMHGTNQRKQGGLTPSQDGATKASPLNKKKKKSSGVLFPSPKDTNHNFSLARGTSIPAGDKTNALVPQVELDTDMEGPVHNNKAPIDHSSTITEELLPQGSFH